MNRTMLQSDTIEELETTLVEHAHSLAMSKDPMVSARGRCLKIIGPAFVQWLDAERARLAAGGDEKEIDALISAGAAKAADR